MPFMDKTCNITRIHMLDAPGRTTFANAVDTLRRYCFHPIDDVPEDKSIGWVNIDDMLDTEWRVSPPQKGGYLAFAMRMDIRRIQPAVLNKERRKALHEEEERNRETGKKFISRQRKMELREQVRMRLKSRMVPTPKVIDVIIDDTQPLIYITTTAPKEVETFCEFFTRSFGIGVAPLDFFAVASMAFPEHNLDALEDAPFGAGAANSSVMPGVIPNTSGASGSSCVCGPLNAPASPETKKLPDAKLASGTVRKTAKTALMKKCLKMPRCPNDLLASQPSPQRSAWRATRERKLRAAGAHCGLRRASSMTA